MTYSLLFQTLTPSVEAKTYHSKSKQMISVITWPQGMCGQTEGCIFCGKGNQLGQLLWVSIVVLNPNVHCKESLLYRALLAWALNFRTMHTYRKSTWHCMCNGYSHIKLRRYHCLHAHLGCRSPLSSLADSCTCLEAHTLHCHRTVGRYLLSQPDH